MPLISPPVILFSQLNHSETLQLLFVALKLLFMLHVQWTEENQFRQTLGALIKYKESAIHFLSFFKLKKNYHLFSNFYVALSTQRKDIFSCIITISFGLSTPSKTFPPMYTIHQWQMSSVITMSLYLALKQPSEVLANYLQSCLHKITSTSVSSDTFHCFSQLLMDP